MITSVSCISLSKVSNTSEITCSVVAVSDEFCRERSCTKTFEIMLTSLAICSESVDTITTSTFAKAAFIADLRTSETPFMDSRFFLGIPLLPPLAGIIAILRVTLAPLIR
jgi:hypothetical protein